VSTVSRQVLGELTRWADPPCTTIYLPLDPGHPDIGADRVMLKDLVRDAKRQLRTASGLRSPAIDELLAPAEALLTSERWPLGCRGCATFAAPGLSMQLQLDVDLPLLSVVADRFVVTPLVAAIERDTRFYVLAISQNRVRFLRGDRRRLVDVPVPGLPASRADALWYEHHERLLNVHGGSHQGADRTIGVLHGSPSAHDLRKHQLLRFFQLVDEKLRLVLRDETAPLFVAGVDYELAIYREANRFPHLAGLVDTGNAERLSTHQLHERVWPAAASVLDSPRRALLDRVERSATPLTSTRAILTACRERRVAALLVAPDRLEWGRLDTLEGRPAHTAGDVDLISLVIGAALEQGADLYQLASGELKGDPAVAAVVRY
jgi:hypothetical protein